MYISKSGVSIPRFNVPSLPQLETALNALSDAVAETSNRSTKVIESSADIRAIDSGDSVILELTNKVKNYKPHRFELFYDSFEKRLYVYEGSVSLKIEGNDKVLVPTIDGKEIYLPNNPEFSELPSFNAAGKLDSNNSNVYRVYVKFDLNAVDDKDKVSLILHDYTQYNAPSGADAFFLIGEVFTTNEITYINQKWSSDIVLSQFDATKCFFRISDISEPGGTGQLSLKIRVAPATVRTMEGTEIYPYSMGANVGVEWLPSTEYAQWRAVYVRIAYDESTKTVLDSPLAVTVMDSDRYLENTSTVQYEYIGSITTSYDESSALYISYIENKCSKVIADPNKLAAPCNFLVEDFTNYPTDGSWPTNSDFKIKISKSKVRDRFPDGMDTAEDYVVDVESELIGRDEFYIYLWVDLDENGEVKEPETAIQIKLHKYWHGDGSGIQRFPIARIVMHSFSYEGNDNARLMEIENYCPALDIHTLGSCPFEVEDASDDYGLLKVQIRNGKIENQYPEGMVAGGSYGLYLDSDNEWSAIYAVIDLVDFVVASNKGSVKFEAFNQYQEDTFEKAYRIIAEVSVSTREDNSKYISFVRNYCYVPEVGEVAYCPFKLTDVSWYNSEGEPTNALVRIQNSKVGDYYPVGMSANTDYIIDLNEIKATYALDVPVVYFYIEQFVDSSGNLADPSGGNDPGQGLSILVTSRTMFSGSRVQRTLIGKVEVVYDGGQLRIVLMKVVNLCTIVTTKELSSCAFFVEEAYSNALTLDRGEYLVGEYEYNFQGTLKPITGVTEIPQEGNWIALYLVNKLDYKGDIVDDPSLSTDSIFFYKTFETYLKSNAFYQYTLAAEIGFYEEGGGKVIDWIRNYCPDVKGPGLEECPFAVVDATSEGVTGVVVRNGRIGGSENRYPSGMDIDTMFYLYLGADESPWYAIYCGMSIDGDGQVLDGDGSVWIQTAYEGYLESTDSTYYVLLAEVYLGYDENSVSLIEFIENKCVVPIPPYDSGLAGGKCLFEVLDWSDPSGAKIRISNGKVEGVYPAGMSPTTDYVYSLDTNDGYFFAVYLVVALGADFNRYTGTGGGPDPTALYFILSNRYLEDTSEEIYNLVAELTVSVDSANGEYISYLKNYCIKPKTRLDIICPFEVVNASNTSRLVRINGGNVNGVILDAQDSEGKSFYQLEDGWQAIYINIPVDDEGYQDLALSPRLAVSIHDDYQKSTDSIKKFLIAEATCSSDNNGAVYTYIWNTCLYPQLVGSIGGGGAGGVNACPFQLIDFSTPTSTGELDLMVKVSKGMVNNRWPSGMSLTSNDYVLDITQTCYVWMLLAYKQDDVELLEEETAITIETSTDLKVNTADKQYELIGTVEISAGGPANGYYISKLTSVCGRIEAKPCSLAWSSAS